MDYLLGYWRSCAEWALGQPVSIQIALGSAILSVAYILFVRFLQALTSPTE